MRSGCYEMLCGSAIPPSASALFAHGAPRTAGAVLLLERIPQPAPIAVKNATAWAAEIKGTSTLSARQAGSCAAFRQAWRPARGPFPGKLSGMTRVPWADRARLSRAQPKGMYAGLMPFFRTQEAGLFPDPLGGGSLRRGSGVMGFPLDARA